MNDDFGTRKAERRRRTTRRLLKHAARAVGEAPFSVPPASVESEPASSQDELNAAADTPLPSAAPVEASPFDSDNLDGPPPATASEPAVEWSAEESPLMAALSAAADAAPAGWDLGDEPDTATHASSPPPALIDVTAAPIVQDAPPSAAASLGSEVVANAQTEFPLDEQTTPGEPIARVAEPPPPDIAVEADTDETEPDIAVEADADETEPDIAVEADADTIGAEEIEETPTHDAWGEIADSDRPKRAAKADEGELEVKTKPKIRLPEGANRRTSGRAPPAAPGSSASDVSRGRLSVSSLPPAPALRTDSPLPPAPSPMGRASRNPPAPTGEGIIRASAPPPRAPGGFGRGDRESDVPTRPRIPLTHDMALAAGRVSSLGVQRALADGDDTRPRLFAAGEAQPEGAAPSVIVTRSHVISDRPSSEYETAADGGDAPRLSHVAETAASGYMRESDDLLTDDAEEVEAAPVRPSRRSRPDSEEFETLDLEEGEEQPSRLEISGASAEMRGSDIGVRVSRTPPPPPAQTGKRAAAPAAVQPRAAPPPPPPGAAKKPAATQKAKEKDKDKEKSRGKRRAWWEVLFSDDYVRTLPRPSQALVAKQVAFMESSLGISRGDAVLDVGCGLGQHALEFARRGYLVVALDLALSMITRAAEEAQQHGLRINFLHKDIRDIGFEGTFDAIICVGTTFGFFDDEQNRGVLQRLAHALKPGGRLLLEVVNRDYVIGSQPNLVWFEGDGCVVMEESDFNFYSSRLNVKRTMMREDGRQTESEYSVRLYSVHELGQLLKQAGFGIKEVSGQEATRGLFFGSQSSRIIMLAERRSAGRSRPDSSPPASD